MLLYAPLAPPMRFLQIRELTDRSSNNYQFGARAAMRTSRMLRINSAYCSMR